MHWVPISTIQGAAESILTGNEIVQEAGGLTGQRGAKRRTSTLMFNQIY